MVRTSVAALVTRPERDRRFSALRDAAGALLSTMRRGPDGHWRTENDDAFVAFIAALNATEGL